MNRKIAIATCVTLISSIISFGAIAKNKVVPYHCPTIQDTSNPYVRTTYSDKSVEWYNDSHNYIAFDKAVEFVGVVLAKKDSDSFDRDVTCLYRSEKNKKIIYKPAASFHWYVDAVVEKPIGTDWKITRNDTLTCTKSVKECGFYFR